MRSCKCPPEATEAQIRDAYRALAWQAADAGGEEARRELNEAYSILSNPARRAAYDQELAARSGDNSAAPLRPSQVPEPTYPQGPWPFQLWGRYPAPVPAALGDVARGQTTPRYITVSGQADYKHGYVLKGTPTQHWYVLYDGPNVVFFQGGNAQTSGAFTGMLQRFTGEQLDTVQESVKKPYWEGATVLSTHYLDLDYTPNRPGWYLVWLAAILSVLLLIVLTIVRRYTVFVPHPLATEAPIEGEPGWPIHAEATGTFRPAEGRGWGTFAWRTPARIAWQAEPGAALVLTTSITWGSADIPHQIVIPPGSTIRTGSDHTGGVTRPALQVRAAGRTVCLRFASVADAQRVAELITP